MIERAKVSKKERHREKPREKKKEENDRVIVLLILFAFKVILFSPEVRRSGQSRLLGSVTHLFTVLQDEGHIMKRQRWHHTGSMNVMKLITHD